jgi:beta-lactamase superfamily II metal-dependent hydrolase
MNVNILNVGDADCIVITTKNSNIVIDIGESDDKDEILNYLKENNITTIDYLILTHFDMDHIGGAPKVINNINTKNVIEPNYIKDSSEYKKLKTTLEEKQITPNILTKNLSFTADSTTFTIYTALKDNYGKNASNEFSLVISATHGSNKFLFAGDAEKERVQELTSQLDLQHTFIKIPHHGVYDKNSEKFLKAVNAKYAVITCSEENPPSSKILDILESTNTKVYLASNGNISCTSDGSNIKISQ